MIAELRRTLLKMVGLSPIAASSAKAELAGMLAGPIGIGLQAAGLAQDSTAPSAENPAVRLLGRKTVNQLDRLMRRNEDVWYRKMRIRRAGYDPDIAALKSTSQAYKEMKQMERELEDMTAIGQIKEYLGW